MSIMSEKTMKKIGITGVMGAGKSSVIDILKVRGMRVLDCDRINDDLLLPHHAGYEALTAQFGKSLLDEDGMINRRNMSDQIFSDPEKKRMAEAILHPLIKKEIQRQVENCKDPLVFIEVPLLYEVGWEAFFDEVWVVASDENLLLKRLAQQRHVEEQEAKRRLALQMSQQEKVEKADHVIWNNSDKEHLKQQIYAILDGECMR